MTDTDNIHQNLTEPYGTFMPTTLQSIIIKAVRRNFIFRSGIRSKANKALASLRPGPIDSTLFDWKFRFFPHENTGDRKALLTPSGFDRTECTYIVDSIKENGVFLDIGSNIGTYSFYVASRRKDVKILAFEPTPRVFAKLNFNIKLNALSNQLIAFNIALSDKKGTMGFNSNRESLVLGEADISVQTDLLLNVMRDQKISHIDALKIDVEGAEDQILRPFFENAEESLWPKLIVIEHFFPEQWDWNCITFLEDNDYELIWQGPMNSVYKRR